MTTAELLREARSLAGQLSDLLDDFGPLSYPQRVQLTAARAHGAALESALNRLDLSIRKVSA